MRLLTLLLGLLFLFSVVVSCSAFSISSANGKDVGNHVGAIMVTISEWNF